MFSEGKLRLRSQNTSDCLIQVVTKADLTVVRFIERGCLSIVNSMVFLIFYLATMLC